MWQFLQDGPRTVTAPWEVGFEDVNVDVDDGSTSELGRVDKPKGLVGLDEEEA